MKKKRKYQTAQPKNQPEPELVQPSGSGPVCVGDIVARRPVTFCDRDSAEGTKLARGRVVYVHPKGRFHVVEFGEGNRAVRESFAGVSR